MQGEDSKQQRRQHKKSLLTNLNRLKPSLIRLHHKQPITLTNTPSLHRGRVLPIPIVQVARSEEAAARRGREDADAAPTDGGQCEVQLRLLPQILYRQGASPGFLDAYEARDDWS